MLQFSSTVMEEDPSIFRSPKRKRGQATPRPSLITTGLSQHIQNDQHQSEEHGSHSPSARVTGKFQKLDLQSPIDLPSPEVNYSFDGDDGSHSISHLENVPRISPSQLIKPPESASFSFESPMSDTSGMLPNPPTTTGNRGKSPPPSSVASEQFWHASEITGWSPGDPDEDNYGINGVGYAKSAGKAWAISQKRKQQIAEYRSRETKEARQRRHERRLSGFNSRKGSPRGSPRPTSSYGDGMVEVKEVVPGRKEIRSVRFEDA